MATLKAIPLAEYIAKNFNGRQTDFARHVGVSKQKVYSWLKLGWLVIDGQLYGPRRGLPEIK